YRRLRLSALARKITRYAIGSVLALLTSVVVFALLYVMHVGTTACSIAAFVVISLLVLVASSAATGWTSSQVMGIAPGHGIRVILVTASYVAVQAFFFA